MKVDINIPDSLAEVTLEQYQKYLKIQNENKDEKFLAVKMIEIFCGLRGDHVLMMSIRCNRDYFSCWFY
jgi:hypothetical protein